MIGPIQKYSVKGIYQLFRCRLSQIFVLSSKCTNDQTLKITLRNDLVRSGFKASAIYPISMGLNCFQ